jgi:hypothetical protein
MKSKVTESRPLRAKVDQTAGRLVRRKSTWAATVICVAAAITVAWWSKPKEPKALERSNLAALQAKYPLVSSGYKLDDEGWVVELSLEGEEYDDDAIDLVTKFKMLRSLSLWKSSISDAGVEKLQELKRLEKLILVWTKISDQSLHHLGNMPSLRYVWLPKTGYLTANAVDQYKPAAGGLRVWTVNLPPKQK